MRNAASRCRNAGTLFAAVPASKREYRASSGPDGMVFLARTPSSANHCVLPSGLWTCHDSCLNAVPLSLGSTRGRGAAAVPSASPPQIRTTDRLATGSKILRVLSCTPIDPRIGLFRRQSSRIGGNYVYFAVSALRTDWKLIDGAPSIGRGANEPLEYRRKVSLRLEAHRQGDFDDWRRRVLQQFLSPQNSPPQDKLVWSQICRRPELRCEVHSTQS
jgi:hypothetical protein